VDEFAELVVVAGQTEAEDIVKALGAAGITAFFRATAGPQEMFRVMVVASAIEEAGEVVGMLQSCECDQEVSGDEAENHRRTPRRAHHTGIVE
jgi:hypothetical protein